MCTCAHCLDGVNEGGSARRARRRTRSRPPVRLLLERGRVRTSSAECRRAPRRFGARSAPLRPHQHSPPRSLRFTVDGRSADRAPRNGRGMDPTQGRTSASSPGRSTGMSPFRHRRCFRRSASRHLARPPFQWRGDPRVSRRTSVRSRSTTPSRRHLERASSSTPHATRAGRCLAPHSVTQIAPRWPTVQRSRQSTPGRRRSPR